VEKREGRVGGRKEEVANLEGSLSGFGD